MDRRFVFPWHCSYVVSITFLDFGLYTQVFRLQYLSFLPFNSFLLPFTTCHDKQLVSPNFLASRQPIATLVHPFCPGLWIRFPPRAQDFKFKSKVTYRITSLSEHIYGRDIYQTKNMHTETTIYLYIWHGEDIHQWNNTDRILHRWGYAQMGYRNTRGGHTVGKDLYREETHTERAHIHEGNIHMKGTYTRRGHTSE